MKAKANHARAMHLLLTVAFGLLSYAGNAQAVDVVTYYHTDGLGTPVMESNAAGQVTYTREHRPYGEQALGAAKNGPGFTGHVGDADTDLIYMQARYYDPVAGRFLSNDPVSALPRSGSNFNRFAYAMNNPYRFIDPNGMLAKSDDEPEPVDCDGPCPERPEDDEKSNEPELPCSIQCMRMRATADQGIAFGAPWQQVADWMSSSNPADKIKAAWTAVFMFGIQGSSNFKIVYNGYQGNDAADAYVTINGVIQLFSGAFRSFSWLGSVLGHEMEGHNDGLAPYGRDLWQSEVNAWTYNRKNIDRFGNSPHEVKMIENRVKFYTDCLAGVGPCR